MGILSPLSTGCSKRLYIYTADRFGLFMQLTFSTPQGAYNPSCIHRIGFSFHKHPTPDLLPHCVCTWSTRRHPHAQHTHIPSFVACITFWNVRVSIQGFGDFCTTNCATTPFSIFMGGLWIDLIPSAMLVEVEHVPYLVITPRVPTYRKLGHHLSHPWIFLNFTSNCIW